MRQLERLDRIERGAESRHAIEEMAKQIACAPAARTMQRTLQRVIGQEGGKGSHTVNLFVDLVVESFAQRGGHHVPASVRVRRELPIRLSLARSRDLRIVPTLWIA